MGVIKSQVASQFLQQLRVERRPGLAADLVAGANYNIFNVGGMTIVQMIWGHVTTVIGGGAAVPQLVHTPTSTGAAVPLSAAHASIANDAVGSFEVNVGGALGTALTTAPALGAVDTAGLGWAGNIILIEAGIISVVNAVASTGILDWYIAYIPCTPQSVVTPL